MYSYSRVHHIYEHCVCTSSHVEMMCDTGPLHFLQDFGMCIFTSTLLLLNNRTWRTKTRRRACHRRGSQVPPRLSELREAFTCRHHPDCPAPSPHCVYDDVTAPMNCSAGACLFANMLPVWSIWLILLLFWPKPEIVPWSLGKCTWYWPHLKASPSCIWFTHTLKET